MHKCFFQNCEKENWYFTLFTWTSFFQENLKSNVCSILHLSSNFFTVRRLMHMVVIKSLFFVNSYLFQYMTISLVFIKWFPGIMWSVWKLMHCVILLLYSNITWNTCFYMKLVTLVLQSYLQYLFAVLL